MINSQLNKVTDELVPTAFLNRIMSYCSTIDPGTDKEEIIDAGLSVLESFPNFVSISLFLFNQFTSQFTLHSSKGIISAEQADKNFRNFVEKDAIAISLNEGSFVGTDDSLEGTKILILPLISQLGIDGLILIVSRQNHIANGIIELTKMHTQHFALRLSNFTLLSDLNSVKDEYIERVNRYTEEIAQSSRGLKKILDAIQAGVILFDKGSGEIVDVNIVAANMIGSSKEDLVGTKRNTHFIFSDYKNSVGSILKSAEVFLKRNDGTIIQVISWLQEVTINNENFVTESFIDITDRKQMETDLQKAHDDLENRVVERTQKLLEMNVELQTQIQEKIKAEEEKLKLYYAVQQSPAIIIITNLNGDIQYVNPIFTEITGYQSDEVIGKNPRFLKSGDVKAVEYNKLWGMLKQGGFWSGEFRNKKKNGELFWVSSFISPIKNSNGEVINYLAIQQDISEKKIAEQNLIEAKERAEKSDKLKSNLLANMSHEFRTPMIGIIGFTQMLQDEVADEEHLYMLGQLSQCNDRLMATINNIMNMSQLQSEDVKLTLEYFDLNDSLQKITSKFATVSAQKGLEYEFIKEVDEIKVSLDRTLCELVLNNMIDNAIKYTPTGKVTVVSKTHTNEDLTLVEVEISDTGIGITEDQYEKIFEPFVQMSTGYSRAQDGLGLGLAVSKKIIELMKGKILVERNLPTGTIFRIIFPAYTV